MKIKKQLLVVLAAVMLIAGFASIPLGKQERPSHTAGLPVQFQDGDGGSAAQTAGLPLHFRNGDGESAQQTAGLPVQFRDGGNDAPVEIADLPVAFRSGNNGGGG